MKTEVGAFAPGSRRSGPPGTQQPGPRARLTGPRGHPRAEGSAVCVWPPALAPGPGQGTPPRAPQPRPCHPPGGGPARPGPASPALLSARLTASLSCLGQVTWPLTATTPSRHLPQGATEMSSIVPVPRMNHRHLLHPLPCPQGAADTCSIVQSDRAARSLLPHLLCCPVTLSPSSPRVPADGAVAPRGTGGPSQGRKQRAQGGGSGVRAVPEAACRASPGHAAERNHH